MLLPVPLAWLFVCSFAPFVCLFACSPFLVCLLHLLNLVFSFAVLRHCFSDFPHRYGDCYDKYEPHAFGYEMMSIVRRGGFVLATPRRTTPQNPTGTAGNATGMSARNSEGRAQRVRSTDCGTSEYRASHC
jgi:hypothetical protein